MKCFKIIGLMFMMACTTSERANWDSGGKARDSYQEEARQEQVEETRNQMRGTTEIGTETTYPF